MKRFNNDFVIKVTYRWTGFIYWGTAFPNAKFNNVDEVERQNDNNHQRVLLYGSVNVNTFENHLNHWKKVEVAGCGKNPHPQISSLVCFLKVINYYQQH